MAAEEPSKLDDPEFQWGKKKGVGGKKKDVQFYSSFTYDGVEYTLYDSVYLYKEGEPEPYIGKLIKIWETADKAKKVKVLWYFRPGEIRNFLEGCEVRWNELFLACGDGVGLANLNPLEAIVGKCNVLCILKDSRNPQPSNEELHLAEFVFYRFFDVGQRKVLDKIDDMIAGVEVKHIFNNLDRQKPIGNAKLGLDKPGISGNILNDKSNDKSLNTFDRENDVSKPLLGGKSNPFIKEENDTNEAFQTIANDEIKPKPNVQKNGFSKLKQNSSLEIRDNSTGGVISGEEAKTISIEKMIPRAKVDSEKGALKLVKGITGQSKKGLAEDVAPRKGKNDVLGEVSKTKMEDNVPNGNDVNIALTSKEKYRLQRANDCCDVEDGPSKKLKIDAKLSKPDSDKFREESPGITPTVEANLDHHPTKVIRRPNIDDEPRKKLKTNEKNSKTSNDKFQKESPRVTPTVEPNVDCDAEEVNQRPYVEDGPSKNLKTTEKLPKPPSDKFQKESPGVTPRPYVEVGPSKKLKTTEKLSKPPSDKFQKESPGVTPRPYVEDGPSKKLKTTEKLSKPPSDKFRKESPRVSPSEEPKLDCNVAEVTRRPDVDRSKWFKEIPWEERMKTAHERGKLVLLENLDPSLTSEQVQDIIFQGFKESCTAHMIQKTACASPHSGQAFVIFKKKETADMVVKKLQEDSLLMSNGCPLVGSIGRPCFPGKKPAFYGHYFLDQSRMLQQREMKNAVSTSHCSQPNNIEYDMAMDWCLLQKRAEKAWSILYQVYTFRLMPEIIFIYAFCIVY
ncbi:protein ANTI-SILENCING 1 isoform X1 [Arachis ipaensis]|uniref:protein ANTI-SILENCING 1 isoform X1 n=1 Tax=Arachis ipaensis TaxID=130454 RepID=UPI000A2B5245|nr:protein ANTI-SILENCING 1 isoform X1 [Arachis ipaensis]